MATVAPQTKYQDKTSAESKAFRDTSKQTFALVDRPAAEWQEAATDKIVQGVGWLAGAASNLSDKLASTVSNSKTRENAAKTVAVVTGAGIFLANDASWIKPVAAYRATADYARTHPKTAIAGGLLTAAVLYGAYRKYSNADPADNVKAKGRDF